MRILFFLLLLPFKLWSQDYAGVWTGYIYSKESQLPYELVISGEKNNLKGYSLTIFTIGDVQNTGIKSVRIKDKKASISIEDDKTLYSDYQTASKKVKMYAELSFEDGSSNVLRGSFFTRSLDRSSYKGTIRVERKEDDAKTNLITHLGNLNLVSDLSFLQPKTTKPANIGIAANTEKTNQPITTSQPETPKIEPVKKDPAVAAALPGQRKVNLSGNDTPPAIDVKNNTVIKPVIAAAADIALRKTEIIRAINFKADSLVLSLYDNGEVDGDTVSVLVNGQLVIARKGLTANAVKTTIYAAEGFSDSLQVVMYAENLGRIAPNTGLLIVEDGEEKYQIRFEGDFQKNAAIVFRRKR